MSISSESLDYMWSVNSERELRPHLHQPRSKLRGHRPQRQELQHLLIRGNLRTDRRMLASSRCTSVFRPITSCTALQFEARTRSRPSHINLKLLPPRPTPEDEIAETLFGNFVSWQESSTRAYCLEGGNAVVEVNDAATGVDALDGESRRSAVETLRFQREPCRRILRESRRISAWRG